MADRISKEGRSRIMSSIRGKNTKPEMLVRSGLHQRGFRFRVHDTNLPGSPDLVLKKYSAVVFVHGCFWHRHKGCKNVGMPSVNREYWKEKFLTTEARDKRNQTELLRKNWRVIVVWECGLRKGPNQVIDSLASAIVGTRKEYVEIE